MAKRLNEILNIKHPVLMAPMFLVSDEKMILAGLKEGITAAFPAANYRTEEELNSAIEEIKSKSKNPFGVNLIVNKSNRDLDYQLQACINNKVDFVITSLGKPDRVIEECHKNGVLVFSDVTDPFYAQKVVSCGADALIAVNKNAGGHPGKFDGFELLEQLTANFNIPIIFAGGIYSAKDVQNVLDKGAAGVSVGTLFLASKESPVSDEYKNAIINYGKNDIVLSDKLSGAPLNVINTPYVQKTGVKASTLNKFLYKHKNIRKLLKGFVMKRGMKSLENAAFGSTYKTVWVAGPVIDKIKTIKPVKEIVKQLTK